MNPTIRIISKIANTNAIKLIVLDTDAFLLIEKSFDILDFMVLSKYVLIQYYLNTFFICAGIPADKDIGI